MSRVIVLFLFSVCLAGGYATECQVGETKEEECNSCVCTAEGEFACTRRICLAPNAKVRREIRVADPEMQCEQGAEWRQDCNKCFCTESGEPVCTRKACVGERPAPRGKRSPYYITTFCQPGTNWTKDCNQCYCTMYGTISCTMKTCEPKDETESSETEAPMTEKPEIHHGPHYINTFCQPGTNWTKGCNQCYCTMYGTISCTTKTCEPKDETGSSESKSSESESSETEGPKTEKPEIHHGPHYINTFCQPGTNWTKGCNQCYCTMHGTISCTTKTCEPKDETESSETEAPMTEKPEIHHGPHYIVTECQPGARCEKDGHEEICTENGTPACLLEPHKTSAEKRPKRSTDDSGDLKCKPGLEWVHGELQCFCTDKGDPICIPKDGPHSWGY